MREMRQWICNFIAIFVLVLGVCVFDTGAEPVLACSKTVPSFTHFSEAAYAKADARQNTDAIHPTGFMSSSQYYSCIKKQCRYCHRQYCGK